MSYCFRTRQLRARVVRQRISCEPHVERYGYWSAQPLTALLHSA